MMPQTCPGSVISPCRVRSQRRLIALMVGLALTVGVSLGAQAATTWTVCASGCDYSRIKAAIATSTTLDGDTLAIAAGTYTEPGITVDKSLTLLGEEAATTIVQAAATQGTAPDRVVTIASGVTVTLQELTIRYGRTTDDSRSGGGLRNAGTITLMHSTIRSNTATLGGGLYNIGTLTVIHSTVHGNRAYGGGGLYNSGTLTLTHSAVSGNSVTGTGTGGGIETTGSLTLTASTVSGNTATSGGGFYGDRGTLTLTASMVAQNGDGGIAVFTPARSTLMATTWIAMAAAS